MGEVIESIRSLRDFVNEPADLKYRLIKDLESWFRLCSAMDVLEDTDMAIQGYLDADANQGGLGERYLHYYGLFQAMVVQQDAVVSVYKSLKVEFDDKLDLQPVEDIRYTRHDAFGHPTDRTLPKGKGGGKYYCQVVQATMGKGSFQLHIANPQAEEGEDKDEFIDINTLDMVNTQQEWTTDKLNKLVVTLKEEHKAYRQKHAGKPLSDAFPKDLKYHLGKIFEGVEQGPVEPMYFGLGLASLNLVCDVLKRLEDMLKERELGLDTYPSIQFTYEELKHPIDQLRLLFSQQISGEELNRLVKDCDAFAWFVNSRIVGEKHSDSLKDCVDEIDSTWDEDMLSG
jgi:hypothetical protein